MGRAPVRLASSAMVVRLVLAAGLAVAANLAPVGGGGGAGPGVGAPPITLSETAIPGHSYTLPSLYLVNTGTETSRYGVRVARLEQGQQRDVPTSWVAVASTTLNLDPKAST